MKRQLKDIAKGDMVKLFRHDLPNEPVGVKYEVAYYDKVDGEVFMRLESEFESSKSYNFLNATQEISMWTSNDIETIEVCKCCGK